MSEPKTPRNWYVADRIATIKSALSDLEWEMTGAHFVDDRAEEMRGLAKRLGDLARPDKGHLKTVETKDAA